MHQKTIPLTNDHKMSQNPGTNVSSNSSKLPGWTMLDSEKDSVVTRPPHFRKILSFERNH